MKAGCAERIHMIAAAAADNVLTPEAVVEDARLASSPLHELFEWDDSVAAHQYRLDQARSIIRRVRVEVRSTIYSYAAVLYVHNPDGDPSEAGYKAVNLVAQDRASSERALEAELLRVRSGIYRARRLAHQLGMVDVFERRLVQISAPAAAELAAKS